MVAQHAPQPSLAVDAAEVERGLRLLVPAGKTFELRAIHVERGFDSIHSGYFIDPATAAKYVARYDSRSIVGWYVTLNPCDPALRARRADRMEKVGKDATTKDHHIPGRARLLLDIDAVRPTGISSSDSEHDAALDLASEISYELNARGWPDPMLTDSGNGAHNVYAIEEDCGDLVEPFLNAAARRWSCDANGVGLKIDTAVHNPARITKLYGTPARKGDDVTARPHRMSRIISAPSEYVMCADYSWQLLAPVTRAQLEDFIAEYGEQTSDTAEQTEPKSTGGKIDVPAWLAKYGYTVLTTAPYSGKKGTGTLYELSTCPYSAEHGERGEAYVIQFDSGAMDAGCHHATCRAAGWRWKYLREKHEPPKPKKAGDGAVKVAKDYVTKHAMHEDGPLLRRWRSDFYRWALSRGCYVQQSDEQIESELYRKMKLGKRSDVGDVRHALIAVDGVLIDHEEMGSWLDGGCDLAPLDVAPCRNGILYLPKDGRRLVPATPRYFMTSALGVEWVECPALPTVWLHFLKQLWPNDAKSIEMLQEWFGYMLTPDTRQQKILLLVGPKRSGKGTLMRVLTALLGPASVASPTLASLGTNFGLWPLIGKTAAIIGDARLGHRHDIAQIVERLLNISGEDGQTIDRKHREPYTGKLSTRITIVSNELPRFTDASDALPGRLLILQLTESFYGNEDTGLTEKLTAELPGILAWAVEGWERLRERGHFVQPAGAQSAIDELTDLGSPVAAWVRERCIVGETKISKDDVLTPAAAYEDFKTWAEASGHKNIATSVLFGRDIKTVAGVQRRQLERHGQVEWVYKWIALNDNARAEKAKASEGRW